MKNQWKANILTDQALLESIKNGDKEIFGKIYDQFAGDLLLFINGFVKNKEVSEDILQEILVSLWNRRDSINLEGTLRNYLFASAKYAVLSYIRSEKIRKKYADHFHLFLANHSWNQTSELADLNDLHTIISMTMENLAPKCKQAFFLSRFQHKTIQEIADEMGISTRTVENYITTAIKTIRQALQNYSWLLLLFHEWIKK